MILEFVFFYYYHILPLYEWRRLPRDKQKKKRESLTKENLKRRLGSIWRKTEVWSTFGMKGGDMVLNVGLMKFGNLAKCFKDA